MKCYFSTSATRRRAERATTLLEMTIVLGLSTLMMAAVMQTSMFTARSFAAMGNYADLDRASRYALDKMSRDIRQAKVLGYVSTNCMTFTNMDHSWFQYAWDPQTKVVSRLWSTNAAGGAVQRETMLTGCDYFSFRVWLRNPSGGFDFTNSAVLAPGLTKLVDVSWKCSRRVLAQFNTESVQTAKIVLRN